MLTFNAMKNQNVSSLHIGPTEYDSIKILLLLTLAVFSTIVSGSYDSLQFASEGTKIINL